MTARKRPTSQRRHRKQKKIKIKIKLTARLLMQRREITKKSLQQTARPAVTAADRMRRATADPILISPEKRQETQTKASHLWRMKRM